MANNRLYIVDSQSGEELMVAKTFGEGWQWTKTPEEVTEWLFLRDQEVAYSNSNPSPTRLQLRTELQPITAPLSTAAPAPSPADSQTTTR